MVAAVTVLADLLYIRDETVKLVLRFTIVSSAPLCPLPITRSIF
jgi:hypothetical protein